MESTVELKSPQKKLVLQTKAVAVSVEASQNCDTIGWQFKVFVSATGSEGLQKNIDEQDEMVTQHFKVRVKYLANTPKRDWQEPYALKLKKVTDIYEIRFKANGVQFRPPGFFGPDANEFTILVWSTHKQKIYDPHDAINTADSRRKLVQTGRARRVPLKVNGEKFPCA